MSLNKFLIGFGLFIVSIGVIMIVGGDVGMYNGDMVNEKYNYEVNVDQVTASEQSEDAIEYSSLSESDKKIIDKGIKHGSSRLFVDSKSELSNGWTLIEVEGVFYLVNIEHLRTIPKYTLPTILVLLGTFFLGVEWTFSQRRDSRPEPNQ